jgi:hypothetical protein
VSFGIRILGVIRITIVRVHIRLPACRKRGRDDRFKSCIIDMELGVGESIQAVPVQLESVEMFRYVVGFTGLGLI